jgi:hypothetical protein
MSKGNSIVVSASPICPFEWGYINDTSLPGTIMQIDNSVGTYGQPPTGPYTGRFAWKASAPGTDGQGVLNAILMEDRQQGFPFTQAYVQGTWGELYYPQSGEEVNILLGEVAGTGNSYNVGDSLMVDAETGILVPYVAGSGTGVFAICLEKVVQAAGSRLTWVKIAF